MTVAIIIYVLTLIVFFIISGLIVRHSIKFGYLSPRFKTVVITFGAIALIIIIFSIFLMFQGDSPSGSTYYQPRLESTPSGSSYGDLNF